MLKTAMSHPAPVPYSPGLPYWSEKCCLFSLKLRFVIVLEILYSLPRWHEWLCAINRGDLNILDYQVMYLFFVFKF
jgi:hypothetical protein